MRLDERQIEVVDDRVAEILRGKRPVERIAIALNSHRLIRQIVRAGVLSRHPNRDSKQVEKEVAQIILNGSE
jgi:hypothetical protein